MNKIHTKEEIDCKILKRLDLLRLSKRLYEECSLKAIIQNYPKLNSELSSINNGTDLFRILEKHKLINIDMKIEEIESFIKHISTVVNEGMMQYIGPDHEIIDYLAAHIGRRWKVFGVLLGLQFHEIGNISENEQSDVQERVRKVLKLKTGVFLNWKMIERALDYMKEDKLMEDLKEQYKELTEGDFDLEPPSWEFFLSHLCQLIAPFVEKLAKILEVDLSSFEKMTHKENLVFELFYEKHRTCVGFNWEMLANAIVKCKERDVVNYISKKKDFADITNGYNGFKCSNKQVICESSESKHSRWFCDQNYRIIYQPFSEIESILEEKADEIKSVLQIKGQDKKFLRIVRGSSNYDMSLAFWTDTFCEDYFKTFLKNLDLLYFNMDTDENVDKFANFLKKSKGNFIIRNYDLYNHFLFLNLEDQISNTYFAAEEACHKIDFIGFEGKRKTMYFIKFSKCETIEEIRKDTSATSMFIAMFIALHIEMLEGYGITFLPIIVIPNEFEQLKKKIKEECEHCGSFVLTKKQFASFENNLPNSIKMKGKKLRQIGNEKFSAQEFRNKMKGIFGYMASENANLVPHIVDDFSEKLDKFMISLYPQQLAYATSTDERVILQGGHGSGKTIVGKLKVKQLAFESPEDIVYSINCGLSEELIENMKDYVASIGNLKNVICCGFNSFQNQYSLSGVLHEIAGIHQNVNKIHLIFDELSIDDITEEDINSFIEILRSQKYENSTVLMICQAMSKERIIKKDNFNLYTSFKNQIEHLVAAGFKLKTLEKSVRYTLAIKKLAEEIAVCLSKMSNRFNTPLAQNTDVKSEAENIFQSNVDQPNTTEPDANEETRLSSNAVGNSVTRSENKTNDFKKLQSDKIEIVSESENAIRNQKDKSISVKGTAQDKSPDLQQIQLPGIDASLKQLTLLKELKEDKTSNNTILESNFKYCVCKEEGHNINGETPFYYSIQVMPEIKDLVQMLVACVNHFISDISDEAPAIDCKDSIAVIHFEDKIPLILSSALSLLKEVQDNPDFYIRYILDVHGLEYKNVIIYIDSQEYHMRHYLIEAITRCKCNLAIIVVNADPTKESAISAMFDKFSNGEGYMDNIITKVDKESISVFLDEVKEYDVRKFLIETESENQSSHNESSIHQWIQQQLFKTEIKNFTNRLEENDVTLIKSFYKDTLTTANMEEITTAEDLVHVLKRNGILKDSNDIKQLELKKKNPIEDESNKKIKNKDIDAFLGYQFDGSEQLLDLLCDKVCWKWELIGAFLCIEFEKIDIVEVDNIYSSDKLRAIFDIKIQSEIGLTWPLINRALNCVNENRLINEIKRDFPLITNENVNDEELEKPNWTYFIAYLSKEVSSFWKDLGKQLKVNVDNIDKDTSYRKAESKAFAVLRESYEDVLRGEYEGVLRGAYEGELQLHWNILSDALKNCRRHDVLRKVNTNKEFSHLMR